MPTEGMCPEGKLCSASRTDVCSWEGIASLRNLFQVTDSRYVGQLRRVTWTEALQWTASNKRVTHQQTLQQQQPHLLHMQVGKIRHQLLWPTQAPLLFWKTVLMIHKLLRCVNRLIFTTCPGCGMSASGIRCKSRFRDCGRAETPASLLTLKRTFLHCVSDS